MSPTLRRDCFRALASFGMMAAPPAVLVGALAVATENPDTEILDLGATLDEALRRSRAAWAVATEKEPTFSGPLTATADALHEQVAAIVHKIEGCAARTFPGVAVKVRAVEWCRSAVPDDFDEPLLTPHDFWGGGDTTDYRLIMSLMEDLRRLAAAGGAA